MAANGRNRTCGGQGLTEYIIVVALVAIAGIGIVNLFGKQMRNQFATIITAMTGEVDSKVKSEKSGALKESGEKNLSNYAGSK